MRSIVEREESFGQAHDVVRACKLCDVQKNLMNADSQRQQARLQEEAHLKVMRLLQSREDITQREIAEALGVSLGKVNYLLRGLAAKGWIKANNFKNSQNKWGYLYQITPSGLEHKARITLRYLQRRMDEYELLKAEVEFLKKDLRQAGALTGSAPSTFE